MTNNKLEDITEQIELASNLLKERCEAHNKLVNENASSQKIKEACELVRQMEEHLSNCERKLLLLENGLDLKSRSNYGKGSL